MFENVHRWLTSMSAIACGSLSQRCQWLSLVRQCSQSWKSSGLRLGELGLFIISDEVKAVWLETGNLKR